MPRLPFCLCGVRGGDLTQRIESIMAGRRLSRLTRSRLVVLVLGAGAFIAAPVMVGALAIRPQADRPTPVDRQRFEVTSIKRNVSGDQSLGLNRTSGAVFNVTNVSMLGTIMRAHQVKNVVAAPDWITDERYDIEAKASGTPTNDDVNAMLRTMLEERLKLKAHIEPREIPVFALVVAQPNHPGRKPFALDCDRIQAARESGNQGPAPIGSSIATPCAYTWLGTQIISGGITMARFAGLLDWVAGRVVIDRTGLSGRYEFTVRFASPTSTAGTAADDRPELFTALREQLGLSLEPARAPVDTLVIDHIERPSEN
jgi:uncharacterized protein (TIGR03435 family)